MKNSQIISLMAFVLLALNASAQNEMYIKGDNDPNSIEVFIKEPATGSPTLFVKGEIINNQGVFQNAAGVIETTGNWTNTADGINAKYESTGIERFSGDTDSRISGNMDGQTEAMLNAIPSAVNQFHNLKIDKDTDANLVDLANNVNIDPTGSLEFETAGRIRTDIAPHSDDGNLYVNELYIRNSAPTTTTITGAATAADEGDKYVEGKLRHQVSGANTYFFPIGVAPDSSDAGTEPVSITFSAADDAGVQVYFEDGAEDLAAAGVLYFDIGKYDPTPGPETINECTAGPDGRLDRFTPSLHQEHQWVVTANAGTNFTYDLTVYPSPSADLAAISSAALCDVHVLEWLAKDGIAGGDAATYIATGTPGYEIIPTGNTVRGQSGFSNFRKHAIADASETELPIELRHLAANGVDNQFIRVDWGTSLEINNEGFEVERSTDGINFEFIGWVEGNGNSTSNIAYIFDDHEVKAGQLYYYRLLQVNTGGEGRYTDVVSAKLQGEDTGFTVYPNPAFGTQDLVAEVYLPIKGEAVLTLINAIGQLQHQQVLQLSEGLSTLSLPLKGLAAGHYFISLNVEGEILTEKVVVLK